MFVPVLKQVRDTGRKPFIFVFFTKNKISVNPFPRRIRVGEAVRGRDFDL